MYIIYLDDSGSTGKDLTNNDQPFQIICAAIVKDSLFSQLEEYFAVLHWYLPEGIRDRFTEFHATDMLSLTKDFQGMERGESINLLENCLALVNAEGIPIVYGAVDKAELSKQIYSSADPINMAFRLCMDGVEQWFTEQAPTELGIVIADDGPGRKTMQDAFRQYRPQVLSSEHNRGRLPHLHDDLYFGDSRFSKGIQLADICGVAISRHLAGFMDTETLYRTIEPMIVSSKIEPV